MDEAVLLRKYQHGEVKSTEELRLVGEVFFKGGDWVRALEIYENLREQIPISTLLRVAEYARGRTDFETAEKAYRFAVDQKPEGEQRDQVRQGLQWLKDRERFSRMGRDYTERVEGLLKNLS